MSAHDVLTPLADRLHVGGGMVFYRTNTYRGSDAYVATGRDIVEVSISNGVTRIRAEISPEDARRLSSAVYLAVEASDPNYHAGAMGSFATHPVDGAHVQVQPGPGIVDVSVSVGPNYVGLHISPEDARDLAVALALAANAGQQ